MTQEPRFDSSETEENKRKALEALGSRGSRHDAATAADVSLKTLDDWRQRDAQFAEEWDATIERVMTRLREQPLDDKGNFKRSPLQYGLNRARNINVLPPDGGDGVLEIRWKEPESQQAQEAP
jgi:hypothetical protein